MIVICIKEFAEEENKSITKYKKYKVLCEGPISYTIINNNGSVETFIKNRFVLVKEFREKKLKRILK